MKKYLFAFFWACLVLAGYAQEQKGTVYGVAFYNLENLFDTKHDEGKKDYEYLPDGRNKWDDKKYQSKLRNMSTVLGSLATDKTPEGAAVIGMAEVENRHVLEDLLKQPALTDRGYEIIHYEGPDERGVDCAFFYNPKLYTVTATKLVPYVLAQPTDRPTRGFLIADGKLAGERVAFIVNHWPSRGAESPARERAGMQVRALKDSLQRLDSKIKILYIEQIKNPDKLLYHASSLIRKGCHIAAIKAGSTDVGQRAASSHTGAIANSDAAVEALLRKAGIVRCFSREELTTVASIFTLKEVKGRNCAIITHAGGPAVMLADALEKGRLNVPNLDGEIAAELKSKLYPGAAVSNPIDIIGTGTPEHLATAIDYCENRFDNIDLMMVIFGSPGLVKLYDAYEVLHKKMETCKKPIFPVLPSIVTAGPEVQSFIKKGHVNFSDEVTLGTALSRVINTPKPMSTDIQLYGVDVPEIRRIIDRLPGSGYLKPEEVRLLLQAARIPLVEEFASSNIDELIAFAKQVKYPVVAKVVGPLHKSDMGGVTLNIRSEEHLIFEYERMMRLSDVTAVMVQPMLKGPELFLGAKYENRFGHVVLCGLGGIFVEVLRDVSYGLAPLSYEETYSMIHSLRGYPIIKGTRGQKGIDERQYADIIVRLSTLLRFAAEIKEMDINPLVATERGLFAVDARIRIEK